MAKRGLGRGLDALIPNKTAEKAAKEKSEKKASKKKKEKTALLDEAAAEKKRLAALKERLIQEEAEREEKQRRNSKPDEATNTETAPETDVVSETQTVLNTKDVPETETAENIEEASKAEAMVRTESVSLTKSEPAAEPDPIAETEPVAAERAFSGIDEDGNMAANSTEAKKEPQEEYAKDRVVNMRISLVEPNRDQPRKYFDEEAIIELSDSIRQFGIIQPLIVQKKDDYYEIIAGERRWRAAKKAGLKEVPVIIRNYSKQEAVEVALIENIQREDLNPIEEAKAYEQLVNEYGLSQEAVAERVSRSRSAVTNSLRLLKLDPEVQGMVETSQISEGHARAILGLVSPVLQKEAANAVLKDHLSVRQTEKMVRGLVSPQKTKKTRDVVDTLMLNDLAEKMKSSLGTKVSIKPSSSQRGKIEIEYYSQDELDRLYEMLLSARS